MSTEVRTNPIVVGLGEVKVTSDPEDTLMCLGLGSCVCVAAYDPVSHTGGMAHIVLPDSGNSPARQTPKFADVAIAMLFEQMTEQGGQVKRLVVKLAGGAHMAPAPAPGAEVMMIGERNGEAARRLLQEASLKIVAEDLGGSTGRTVRMRVDTGLVTVVTAGKDERVL